MSAHVTIYNHGKAVDVGGIHFVAGPTVLKYSTLDLLLLLRLIDSVKTPFFYYDLSGVLGAASSGGLDFTGEAEGFLFGAPGQLTLTGGASGSIV